MTEPDPSHELHGLDPGELLARGLNTVRPSGGMHNWTPPAPEELARLLPQYHIESMLGHGGMGAVYKGFQEKLARPVAIKLLPAELTADQQFVARFEREAKTLAKLQHPGIVAIYDFGQTGDGHLYFVMEYVEGTDLRRILQGPGLNSEQALEIIVQVCEALQAAHRQGVIHRDIKPANILIASDGRVKLADFGLARPDREENENLTLPNVVLGTPDYMAPEQHGGQPDHRADIFALGLMLYEMLTGQLPRGAFVPPSRKVQVDVRIDEVVIKALQEEPDLRYQQASEMKTDVDHIRSSVVESVPAVPSGPSPVPGKSHRKAPLIAISAGIAVLGVAAFLLFGKATPPASKSPPISSLPEPQLAASTETVPASPRPAQEQQAIIAETPASATPPSLESVLYDYDWQYRTTRAASASRESYTYVHGLFFEKDGTVYSRGRKQLWKWLWRATGPRTVHIDQQFRGYTIDMTFDPSFTTFEGEGSDGSTLAGNREKRFAEEEILEVRQQIQERLEQTSPAENAAADEADPNERASTLPAPSTTPSAPLENPAPAPQSVTAAESSPKNASEALLASSWYFTNSFEDSDANKSVYVFKPDGTIKNVDGTSTGRTWEAKGSEAFTLFSEKSSTVLTFNKTFTRFEGKTIRGNGTAVGTPIESPKSKGVEISVVAAQTMPLPAAQSAPQNAAEALVAFRWKFDSPGNKGELTFLPGGGMNKSWKQAFPWRWEAVSESEFMMREMGGKRHVTTLVFNEGFTSFAGPGFSDGQTYRGSRVEPPPVQPTVTSTASPTPEPPAPTPAASPAKSNLDILAESGPQITDQVLSPLDAPSIPEATVSSWEEDLLDEAAKRPADFQPAYRQAAALLAAWKTALRERYQILGTAKFSGVVMDSPDMQSGRKTVLHMWDWLQYARERDDAAKHEKKLERTAEFFASGPPRRWADRSGLLRTNIEKIYAIFRQARREALAKSPKPTPNQTP